MLTPSPLPAWLNLCRAIAHRPPSDADLAAPWHRDGEVAGWLSRSAWSLALITLWRQKNTAKLEVAAWLPDFFCDSALAALRKTGAKLVFYPLTITMAPDMAACRILAEATPPDLFLLPHYFGEPNSFVSPRDFCKHHGAWLIEDGAHVLRPVNGIGIFGDFVIYSPHKNLPISDGAVLIVRPDGPSRFGVLGLAGFGLPVSWCAQLRDLQRQMGSSVKSTQVYAVVWLVKRLLQKLGISAWRPSLAPFAEPRGFGEVAVARLIDPSQSRLARRLLAATLPSLGTVARLRQRHQLLLDTALLNDETCALAGLSSAERSINREWTPYLAGYRVDFNRAQVIYEQWQGSGLPVTTWPDLPPEVMENRERHANALNLRYTRVYLPVHQGLSMREMLKKCRSLKFTTKSQLPLRVVWNGASLEQYQNWMTQAGRSNLLQNWAYGEAKSEGSSWRVKRGVFYRGDEPIAFVQVLQKYVAGVILLSRINRGPLFLKAPMELEQRAVWEALASLGNLWRGRILSAAPELRLLGSNLAMMSDLGYRQFSPIAWESVWIDLNMELAELRKKLDGKWRNMLSFSENAGLSLKIGNDNQSFEWMMERYQELMREKGFSGPPIELLRSLRKHLADERPLVIMRAMHGEEAVAGICLVTHGSSATYLLGWNGCAGRNLKANQYLLWQAIVYLKETGLDWFDLGGINEDHTSGIAVFKLGLKGERYELLGEYWKC